MKYAQHPLSAAFPAMSAEDFQQLQDSISECGVLNPIVIHDGMVLDGWHRYTAASSLSMPCPEVALEDWIDPKDFVLAQNKHRRHITQAQIAMATTAVYEWAPAGNPAFSQPGTECRVGQTTARLAEMAGVGERTIRQAKAVHTNGEPEVIEAVKRGDIGLPKATAIVKLPRERQAQAIAANPARPTAKPTPEPDQHNHELDEAANAINELSEENTALRDRLAVAALEGTDEERASAAQTIDELRKQCRLLEIQNAAIKSSRDHYMLENAELKKQCARLAGQLKRAGGSTC